MGSFTRKHGLCRHVGRHFVCPKKSGSNNVMSKRLASDFQNFAQIVKNNCSIILFQDNDWKNGGTSLALRMF